MTYPPFAGCKELVLRWITSGPFEHDARQRCRSVSPKVPKRSPPIRPVFDLIERSLDSQTRLVAPVGDLDAATNPAFRDAIQAGAEGERLVLDLSQVNFMSAGAIGVIARTRTRMARGHGELFVICPSPRLRRLFEIAGMADTLDFLASRGSASRLMPARRLASVTCGQSPSGRDLALPAPAQGQPRGLVPVGRGGACPGARRGPADPALDRLFGLPLVPRDGARVLRGRGDRQRDERALRVRSSSTARSGRTSTRSTWRRARR